MKQFSILFNDRFIKLKVKMELNHTKDRLCRSTTEPSVNLTYSLIKIRY